MAKEIDEHNIEFSCRPESDRYAPVRPTTFLLNGLHPGGQLQRSVTSPTDDGGAVSRCTKPRTISNPSPRSALLGLPVCTFSHGFPFVPIQAGTLSHQPKPAVLTGCTPAIKTDARVGYYSVRPAMIHHTPGSVLQSGAGRHERHSIPILAKIFAYVRFRSAQKLVLYRLHSFFPFCTHCFKRPSQTDAARPQVCQEASPSFVLLRVRVPTIQTSFW